MSAPVVEIEQPLLAAPEVADLAKQTQFDVTLDGMTLTLLGEEEDPLAVSGCHVLHYKYCAGVDRDSRVSMGARCPSRGCDLTKRCDRQHRRVCVRGSASSSPPISSYLNPIRGYQYGI